MKKLLLMGLIGASLFAETKGNLTPAQVESAQMLIILSGYKCDKVDFALRSGWSGIIDVTCNNYKYSYDLEDVGGRWTVTVD
jgi:hypothetical protein